jgi:hypothetical protein
MRHGLGRNLHSIFWHLGTLLFISKTLSDHGGRKKIGTSIRHRAGPTTDQRQTAVRAMEQSDLILTESQTVTPTATAERFTKQPAP